MNYAEKDEFKKLFKQYMNKMQERYQKGEKKFGTRFLKMNVMEEIEEELLDVSVWASLLYIKIQLLKKKMERNGLNET